MGVLRLFAFACVCLRLSAFARARLHVLLVVVLAHAPPVFPLDVPLKQGPKQSDNRSLGNSRQFQLRAIQC